MQIYGGRSFESLSRYEKQLYLNQFQKDLKELVYDPLLDQTEPSERKFCIPDRGEKKLCSPPMKKCMCAFFNMLNGTVLMVIGGIEVIGNPDEPAIGYVFIVIGGVMSLTGVLMRCYQVYCKNVKNKQINAPN